MVFDERRMARVDLKRRKQKEDQKEIKKKLRSWDIEEDIDVSEKDLQKDIT